MISIQQYTLALALTIIAPLILAPVKLYADSTWDAAAWESRSPQASELQSLLDATSAARDLTNDQLYQTAFKESQFISHKRPEIEWTAWRLAHLYRLTGESDYAEKAASALAGLATRATPEPKNGIHVEGKWIPYPAVIAYGILARANYWEIDNAQKFQIRKWLYDYKISFEALTERPGQITNYTPFGLRHAAVLALVLNDGDLVNLCYQIADELTNSPDFWTADTIWQEGTVSYARQVSGNLRAIIPLFRAGIALESTVIDESSLELFAQRLHEIDAAQSRFRMPSGRPIPVNDTHWSVPSDSIPRAPKTVAFPDFGHFAIAGSDLETHLSIPTLTGGGRYGGGHYHDSRLSLQLWAHGQEILPDAGYPFQPANNRYFHMSPLAHNTSIVADANIERKGSYGVWEGDWARSALLGFEDGTATDGLISYIAAASPGPENEGIDMLERQLVQVSTGDWSGYVIDAFWLQGGTVHQSFLRQSEDEPCSQLVSAPLVHAGTNMAEVLEEESEGDLAWSAQLRCPKQIDSEQGFEINWTGQSSGVSLRAFIAPQPGSTSWLSQMPRLRPTNQNPALKDDFPGWHLLRQNIVEAGQTTLWAAVYEPVSNGETVKIKSIFWQRSDYGDAVLLKVNLGDRVDTWMLSCRKETLQIGDYSLSGNTAGYSESSDQITWKWAAAGSSLTKADKTIISYETPAPYSVFSLAETQTNGHLTVDAEMDRPPSGWLALRFAEGSGRGLYVGEVVSKGSGQTTFQVPEKPGMTINQNSLQRTSFPLHRIDGPTTVTPLGARFIKVTKH